MEDDLRSRIVGTFVVKFLACLPLLSRIFEHLQTAEIFEKVSFDSYDFRITRRSARKSEQMKNFYGIKICVYLLLNTKIRLTMLCNINNNNNNNNDDDDDDDD